MEMYECTEDQECAPVGDEDFYGATQIQYVYDEQGNLTHRIYNDSRSDAPNPELIREVVYTYDSHRNMTSRCWLDDKGVLVPDHTGYAAAKSSYDGFNRLVKLLVYDEAGALVGWTRPKYDSQGRNTRNTYYEADGSVWLVKNMTYDEFGNCVQEAYTDGNGRPIESSTGYALIRSSYDVFGNVTDRWSYDGAGNPCGDEFHKAYTYSVTGQTLTEAYKSVYQPADTPAEDEDAAAAGGEG